MGRAVKEKGEEWLQVRQAQARSRAALPQCSPKRDAVPRWCVHRCEEDGCNGLLRPHVVWFGEALDPGVLTAVEKELDICDLCLVVSGAFLTCP